MSDPLLPAFARPLVAQRMAGHHPLFVNVLFGRDWSRAQLYWDRTKGAARKVRPFCSSWREQLGDPWVAIGPRQFEAGRFDLRCVVGCWVHLHDGDGIGGYESGCPLLVLGAELARQASAVSIIGGPLDGKWMDWVARVMAPPAGWPAWWSDELDRTHERRYQEWQRENESRWETAA